ncbi:MAG: tetraacyldisaccharide 4'-kinase [Elusimicrobia bacterium CG1_02_63_36]|nr:MAG: tetraacyldisaccharide 4'-kinase [Elusimicrobia bacterium CG1_02_63_36]
MSLNKTRERLRGGAWGRFLLACLSLAYEIGVRLRNALYGFGLLPTTRLGVRVVCIGNLTTGGTGKTPAVLLAAQTLHKLQVKTAILSRGYGRRGDGRDVQVLLNSQNVHWQDTGDEPWMMHRALNGTAIPILICSDRAKAGLEAMNYYDPETLLLDDGFQHRRLKRDLDIVLVNALDPFGGGKLLPAGDLREPISSLRRAGMAVITHSDQVPPERVSEIRDTMRAVNPQLKILEAVHRADFLLDLKSDRRRRLTYLKGKQIVCLSALGDPRPFEAHLEATGGHLTQRWRYRDHHPYTLDDLKSIESVRHGAALITTFKDMPRLPPGWQEILAGEVLALGIRMEITKGRSAWERALVES